MKQKDFFIDAVIVIIMVLLILWIDDYMSDDIARDIIMSLVFGIGMTLHITFLVRTMLIDQGFEKRDALVPYPMMAVSLLAFSALFFLIVWVIGILF